MSLSEVLSLLNTIFAALRFLIGLLDLVFRHEENKNNKKANRSTSNKVRKR